MLIGKTYVTSLLETTIVRVHNQTRLQWKNRQMYIIQESKLALSADDMKRNITKNVIRTRSLGHYFNKIDVTLKTQVN